MVLGRTQRSVRGRRRVPNQEGEDIDQEAPLEEGQGDTDPKVVEEEGACAAVAMNTCTPPNPAQLVGLKWSTGAIPKVKKSAIHRSQTGCRPHTASVHFLQYGAEPVCQLTSSSEGHGNNRGNMPPGNFGYPNQPFPPPPYIPHDAQQNQPQPLQLPTTFNVTEQYNQTPPRANNSIFVKAADVLGEFNGNGPTHPVEYISQLEVAVRAGYLPSDQASRCLRQQLRGQAYIWGQAMLKLDDTFETVCSKFVERYWGREQQIQARLKLETDRYRPSESSYLDHFYSAWSVARHLTVTYPEQFLWSLIAGHYPPDVQIGLRGVSSVEDFEERLQIYDRGLGAWQNHPHGDSVKHGSEMLRPPRFPATRPNKLASIEEQENSAAGDHK